MVRRLQPTNWHYFCICRISVESFHIWEFDLGSSGMLVIILKVSWLTVLSRWNNYHWNCCFSIVTATKSFFTSYFRLIHVHAVQINNMKCGIGDVMINHKGDWESSLWLNPECRRPGNSYLWWLDLITNTASYKGCSNSNQR